MEAAGMTSPSIDGRSLVAHAPRLAWCTAWLAIPIAILNSLARFATDVGKEDVTPLVSAWANPAKDFFAPLLNFADPNHVYVWYGMLWAPLFLIGLLCAVAVRRGRPSLEDRRTERWAWRVHLAGLSLFTLGTFTSYYGSWISQGAIGVGFAAFILPGYLVSLIGGTWLGVSLLRGAFRPRTTALMLALIVPLALAVNMVMSLGSALVPVLFAWGFAGRALSSQPTKDAG
jgi:hypothetical protein